MPYQKPMRLGLGYRESELVPVQTQQRFSIEKGAFLQVNYSWGERSEQNMSE